MVGENLTANLMTCTEAPMKNLLLLAVLAFASVSSGCYTSSDDPYCYDGYGYYYYYGPQYPNGYVVYYY